LGGKRVETDEEQEQGKGGKLVRACERRENLRTPGKEGKTITEKELVKTINNWTGRSGIH